MTQDSLQNILTQKVNDGKLDKVTDLKLVRKSEKASTGFAFVGFDTHEAASKAVQLLNNSYIQSTKVSVEIAKSLNDPDRPLSYKKKQEEYRNKQKEKDDYIRICKMKVTLRSAENDQTRLRKLLNRFKNDEKFVEYLKTTLNAAPIMNKVEKTLSKKEETNDEEDNSDHEIEADNNEDSGIDEISDDQTHAQLWANIIGKKFTANLGRESKVVETVEQKKVYDDVPTVKITINKFPKVKQRVNGKTNKGLIKEDIVSFFKPLDVVSFRVSKKLKFTYFATFKTEKTLGIAMRKNGSFLLGVKVNLSKVIHQEKIEKGAGLSKWEESKQRLDRADPVIESGKVFVRNLPYTTTEEDLQEIFKQYGEVSEVDLPVDHITSKVKGFATITFLYPQNAVEALNATNTDFRGRALQFLPCLNTEQIDETKSWFGKNKAKNEDKKPKVSPPDTWNTLFVSSASVAKILSKKYDDSMFGQETLNSSESAKVVMALGETSIVNDTKKFLEAQGISMEAFTNPAVERSKKILLVKNLKFETKASEVAEMFGKFGNLGRVVMPPYGTTAVVEYLSSSNARKALLGLHMSPHGSMPLYVEFAPVQCFDKEITDNNNEDNENKEEGNSKEDQDEASDDEDSETESKKTSAKRKAPDTESDEVIKSKKVKSEPKPELHTTIYVQNLPKDIPEAEILEHFNKMGTVFKLVVAKKGTESRGYGFVQYFKQKHARKALGQLDNSTLGGRDLTLRLSEKVLTEEAKSTRKILDVGEAKIPKIIVKNIPFDCTKKDMHDLFRSFGSIQRIFLAPHKLGGFNNGGYAFVHFNSLDEAKRCMELMGLSTHISGRRLAMYWANEDETVDEMRTKNALKRDIVEAHREGTTRQRAKDTLKESSGF